MLPAPYVISDIYWTYVQIIETTSRYGATVLEEGNPAGTARRGRRQHARVTIADVAREAGVGTTTVSRVIRNVDPISAETRKIVEAAIKKTGYTPNLLAGSLASATSKLIGVVVPSTRTLIFLDLLHGIRKELRGTEFKLIVVETEYDVASEEEIIRSLVGWKPAAIIIMGLDHSPGTEKLLKDYPGRVIEVMDLDGTPIDTAIGFSNDAVGALTIQHLISRGYKRFAYVGHAMAWDIRGRKRFLGMTRTLAENGLAFVTTHFSDKSSTVAMGRQATEDIRTLYPDVDVIIYVNDTVALGGLFYCMSQGIRVPEDVALFGFNPIEMSQEIPTPIATVDNHPLDIGAAAAKEAISSAKRPKQPRKIDTGLSLATGATA